MQEINQKSKGGKRPGAGRKPSTLKGVLRKLPTATAELILAEINAHQRLVDLANSKDEQVALKTIIFLWEQARGKAKQVIGGDPNNPLTIKHEFDASRLTDEQLAELERLVESAHLGSHQG